MNVSLTPELEQFVAERVASGQYQSAGDVIRDALRLLREREQEQQARLAALKADIDEGIASLERGERIPGDEAFTYLRARRVTHRKQ